MAASFTRHPQHFKGSSNWKADVTWLCPIPFTVSSQTTWHPHNHEEANCDHAASFCFVAFCHSQGFVQGTVENSKLHTIKSRGKVRKSGRAPLRRVYICIVHTGSQINQSGNKWIWTCVRLSALLCLLTRRRFKKFLCTHSAWDQLFSYRIPFWPLFTQSGCIKAYIYLWPCLPPVSDVVELTFFEDTYKNDEISSYTGEVFLATHLCIICLLRSLQQQCYLRWSDHSEIRGVSILS